MVSRYNKVVWSEGLFLHPQLFQQQERYLEHLAHRRALPLSAFFWGCSQLEPDNDSLALGTFALRKACGLFQDGTPFDAPSCAPLPPPLTVLPAHVGQVLYLTLPLRLPDAEEITFDARSRSQARYSTCETEIPDTNSLGMEPQTVQLAHLRLGLVPEQELSDNVMGLAVAHVLEVNANGGVRLDPEFVPACTLCTGSEKLVNWLHELHGLTHLRATVLAESLVGPDSGETVSEIADYLLLQTLNHYAPLLGHLKSIGGGNPEALYRLLLSMAGELSTFLRFQTRLPAVMPPYRHDRPGMALRPLVEDLRLLLNIVPERGAQRIPLQEQQNGHYLAVLAPGEGDRFSALVLSVSARMNRDALQHAFLTKTKIGPPEHLPQLICSHVPGITLQPLPLAPRQLPFNANAMYFELRREGKLWEQIQENGALGLHAAGNFPGLHLELWGTREQ